MPGTKRPAIASPAQDSGANQGDGPHPKRRKAETAAREAPVTQTAPTSMPPAACGSGASPLDNPFQQTDLDGRGIPRAPSTDVSRDAMNFTPAVQTATEAALARAKAHVMTDYQKAHVHRIKESHKTYDEHQNLQFCYARTAKNCDGDKVASVLMHCDNPQCLLSMCRRCWDQVKPSHAKREPGPTDREQKRAYGDPDTEQGQKRKAAQERRDAWRKKHGF